MTDTRHYINRVDGYSGDDDDSSTKDVVNSVDGYNGDDDDSSTKNIADRRDVYDDDDDDDDDDSSKDIIQFNLEELSERLIKLGVRQEVINRIRSEADGEKTVCMSPEKLKDLGIPGGKLIIIMKEIGSIAKTQMGAHSKIPGSVGPTIKPIDVFLNYDCEELRDTTLEKALEMVGVTRKNREFKHINDAAKVTKERNPSSPLSIDEMMAIHIYTYDYGSERMEKNLYHNVNKRLREGDICTPQHADLYMLYFLAALRRLKKYKMGDGEYLYRGICSDEGIPRYRCNDVVEWIGFSSTSAKLGVAKSFLRPNSKYKYLFKIGGNPVGYFISDYSFVSGEKEILIEPSSVFNVEKCEYDESCNVTIVTLRYVKSKLLIYDQTRFLTLIKDDDSTVPTMYKSLNKREFSPDVVFGENMPPSFETLESLLLDCGVKEETIYEIKARFAKSEVFKKSYGDPEKVLKAAILFAYTASSHEIKGGSIRNVVNGLPQDSQHRKSWFGMLSYSLGGLKKVEEPNETRSLYVLGECSNELCSIDKSFVLPAFVTAYRSVADVYAQALKVQFPDIAIFQIRKKCWGYDISEFSAGFLPEGEVILLPEQTFVVKSVYADPHFKKGKRVVVDAENCELWEEFMNECYHNLSCCAPDAQIQDKSTCAIDDEVSSFKEVQRIFTDSSIKEYCEPLWGCKGMPKQDPNKAYSQQNASNASPFYWVGQGPYSSQSKATQSSWSQQQPPQPPINIYYQQPQQLPHSQTNNYCQQAQQQGLKSQFSWLQNACQSPPRKSYSNQEKRPQSSPPLPQQTFYQHSSCQGSFQTAQSSWNQQQHPQPQTYSYYQKAQQQGLKSQFSWTQNVCKQPLMQSHAQQANNPTLSPPLSQQTFNLYSSGREPPQTPQSPWSQQQHPQPQTYSYYQQSQQQGLKSRPSWTQNVYQPPPGQSYSKQENRSNSSPPLSRQTFNYYSLGQEPPQTTQSPWSQQQHPQPQPNAYYQQPQQQDLKSRPSWTQNVYQQPPGQSYSKQENRSKSSPPLPQQQTFNLYSSYQEPPQTTQSPWSQQQHPQPQPNAYQQPQQQGLESPPSWSQNVCQPPPRQSYSKQENKPKSSPPPQQQTFNCYSSYHEPPQATQSSWSQQQPPQPQTYSYYQQPQQQDLKSQSSWSQNACQSPPRQNHDQQANNPALSPSLPQQTFFRYNLYQEPPQADQSSWSQQQPPQPPTNVHYQQTQQQGLNNKPLLTQNMY